MELIVTLLPYFTSALTEFLLSNKKMLSLCCIKYSSYKSCPTNVLRAVTLTGEAMG